MRRASQAEAELARLQSRFIEGAIAPPPPRLDSSNLRLHRLQQTLRVWPVFCQGSWVASGQEQALQ